VKTTIAILVLATMVAIGACEQKENGASKTESATELVGTVWQWQEFQDSAEGDEASHIRVPDPTMYTLTLQSDDRASIQADCNQVSWTYTLEGSRLTFNTLGPSTLAHCGDESLDQRYLARLGNTATYVIAEGKLYLNLRADAGNLVFIAAK
jgi:heat shock protein HslJ